MNHTFILKSARWAVKGHYWQKNNYSSILEGLINISLIRESWFKINTQLFIGKPSLEIVSECKGFLDNQRKSYTYVLQHNILGRIEGEGCLGSDSIIQHYWIVGSNQTLSPSCLSSNQDLTRLRRPIERKGFSISQGSIQASGETSEDADLGMSRDRKSALTIAQSRRGFDTFYRINEDAYHFNRVLLQNHNIASTMEATLKYII